MQTDSLELITALLSTTLAGLLLGGLYICVCRLTREKACDFVNEIRQVRFLRLRKRGGRGFSTWPILHGVLLVVVMMLILAPPAWRGNPPKGEPGEP